ncbi:hypothetical protein B0T14DRAFT_571614 [Immersiella caudata]|uniref:Uncharacterized protein n=1 Tax=Immersiella caudata TaxID=314043 RepID=A0AA39U4Q7_9PEZI|nr:hypothetical protein B0T14DRAFT_571614 [Immersiella caudata]
MPIRRQSTTDSIHSIDPTNNLGIKLGDLEATLGEKAYVLGEWLRDFEQKENVLEERQRVLEDRESALDKREAKLQERESSLSLESGQSETANASKLGKLDVEAERVNIEKVYNQMREMKKRDRRLRDTLKELDLEWVLGPAARQEPASDFF